MAIISCLGSVDGGRRFSAIVAPTNFDTLLNDFNPVFRLRVVGDESGETVESALPPLHRRRRVTSTSSSSSSSTPSSMSGCSDSDLQSSTSSTLFDLFRLNIDP